MPHSQELRLRFQTGLLVALTAIVITAPVARASGGAVTEAELLRRTQELFDAVAGGNQEPWKKYFAADCMYFDEKGRNMDKAGLVADITPLPRGYSGNIKVINPHSRIAGDTAILSYDLDETEYVFGRELKARYHATDTWMRRNGAWQIVAGQVFRYYEDPAAGKIDASHLNDYVGTYQMAPGETIVISRDGDRLFSQRGKRAKQALTPEITDMFFRAGIEGRFVFHRDAKGKVDTLIDRRNNEDLLWHKL